MKRVLSISLLSSMVLASVNASADLIQDSKLDLEARNFYLNNQNRNSDSAQSKTEQWGQGFVLRGTSGYTEGTVGVGIDALAMWGFRLYAPEGHNSQTGLFPYRDNGTVDKSFASFRVTGKLKTSETELKIGALQPNLPILLTNNSRLLPEVYRGIALNSKDITDLNLNFGYIDRVQGRNSTGFDRLKAHGAASDDSKKFIYAGGDYSIIPELNVAYYFSQLKDFYSQHYVGVNANIDIGAGVLQPDLRYFHSKDEGSSYAGRIDNNLYSGLLTYNIWGHSFGAGIQKLSGDTSFAYLDPGQSIAGDATGTGGASTYTIADSQINNFLDKKERTWLVKYSYDFAKVGLDGLNVSAVYLYGDKVSGSTKGNNEWERDIAVSYTIPEGTFKNLGVTLKNAAYRTNVSGNSSQDDNRVIVSYKASFF